MQVHAFRSGKKAGTYGITEDKTGSNLPSELAPWKLRKSFDLDAGQNRTGLDSDKALAGIGKDGYFITAAELTFEVSNEAGAVIESKTIPL